MSNKLTWGSHVPLNKSLLNTFEITGVTEFGIGHNSTPVFAQHANKVIAVESDSKWLETMSKEYPATGKLTYIHHKTKYSRTTRPWDIKEQDAIEYKQFLNTINFDNTNMLFIDCYSGYRLHTFNHIHHKFDFITMHDVQNPGITNHWGGKTPTYDKDRYTLYVDKTYSVWTWLLIDNKHKDNIGKLIDNHDKFAKQYSDSKGRLIIEER